jgi:DNA-binding transcriptional MerR regulator
LSVDNVDPRLMTGVRLIAVRLDFECTRSEKLGLVTVQTQQAWSVSEAAERVGLTTHTLRWYEQEGLVEPVGRDSAGRRRYTQEDLDRLHMLTCLRRTGMPVRDMRRYAELARQGDATLVARLALFQEHRERVLARIAELQEDLKYIEYKIDWYAGEMAGR